MIGPFGFDYDLSGVRFYDKGSQHVRQTRARFGPLKTRKRFKRSPNCVKTSPNYVMNLGQQRKVRIKHKLSSC